MPLNSPTDVLSLNDAKLYIKADYNDDDDLIESLIVAAVGYVEQETNYRLYQRNEVIYITGKVCYESFQYPLNGASVVNIDSADVTDYTSLIQMDYRPLRTIIGWGNGYVYWDAWYQFFTNYYLEIYGNKRVTFVLTLDVGYTDVTQIPQDLMTAIKQIISYTYENRDMAKVDYPSNIVMLLSKYKRFATIL